MYFAPKNSNDVSRLQLGIGRRRALEKDGFRCSVVGFWDQIPVRLAASKRYIPGLRSSWSMWEMIDVA